MTSKESLATLLPEIIEVLEDVVAGFGSMVEGEARLLSSSALTIVLSHLYLQDAGFDLSSFLTLADSDSQDAAATAMRSSVDAMLSKYLVVGPPTEVDATGDAPGDGAPLAGDGSTRV